MKLKYIYLSVLIFLIGTAVWRAMNKRPEPPTTVQGTASTRPAARPAPRPPGPPEPTAEEIARLSSPDRVVRLEGAELLSMRSVTPALIAAVEKARVDYADDEAMMLDLSCLKVRFPDRESLDLALSMLPADESAFRTRPPRQVMCALNAVAARAVEDPARIRPILLAAAMSPNYATSEAALRGLERTPPSDLPASVRVQAAAPNEYTRQQAIRVAMAAGAVDVLPSLVERALVDESKSVRTTARAHVRKSSSPNAARLVAFAVVRSGDEQEALDLFVDRENQFRDATPALLDVVDDQAADVTHRQAAVAMLVKRGNPKTALPRLHAARDAAPSPLRERIEEAIVELDRRAAGLPGR